MKTVATSNNNNNLFNFCFLVKNNLFLCYVYVCILHVMCRLLSEFLKFFNIYVLEVLRFERVTVQIKMLCYVETTM